MSNLLSYRCMLIVHLRLCIFVIEGITIWSYIPRMSLVHFPLRSPLLLKLMMKLSLQSRLRLSLLAYKIILQLLCLDCLQDILCLQVSLAYHNSYRWWVKVFIVYVLDITEYFALCFKMFCPYILLQCQWRMLTTGEEVTPKIIPWTSGLPVSLRQMNS